MDTEGPSWGRVSEDACRVRRKGRSSRWQGWQLHGAVRRMGKARTRRVGGARALVGSESSQMLKAECLAFPLGNRTIKAVTQEGCWPAYLLTLPGWLRGGSGRWKSV